MPIDVRDALLEPTLIVSDVNQDMDVEDQFDYGSADGLITGRVVATVGADGKTRYLPLVLEVNPNIVKQLTDSYLPMLNQENNDKLVFTLTLGGGNDASTKSWAKVYSESRREICPNGDHFEVRCSGGPIRNATEVYDNDGYIPPFFVSIDTELAKDTSGALYAVTLDITLERGRLLTPLVEMLMSKRYRLYRNDSEMVKVTTEAVDVGDGNYDPMNWALADRDDIRPILRYE